VDFLRGLRGTLVTNLPVITAVVYMLDFNHQAQRGACLGQPIRGGASLARLPTRRRPDRSG